MGMKLTRIIIPQSIDNFSLLDKKNKSNQHALLVRNVDIIFIFIILFIIYLILLLLKMIPYYL